MIKRSEQYYKAIDLMVSIYGHLETLKLLNGDYNIILKDIIQVL